jgi:hypothetical protein
VYAATASSACHRNAGEGPLFFALGASNARSGTRGVSSIGGGNVSDASASRVGEEGGSFSSSTGRATLVPSRRNLTSRALARVHHGTCGSSRWLSSPARAARSSARIVAGVRSANVNASPRDSFSRFARDNAHRALFFSRSLFVRPSDCFSPSPRASFVSSSSPEESESEEASVEDFEREDRGSGWSASASGAYFCSNAAIFLFSSSSTTSPRMASPRASPWKDSTQRASCDL